MVVRYSVLVPRNRFVLKTLLAFAGLSLALPAYAYLDPGTGSVLLQSLIGLVALAGAAIGTYFSRIRAFFFRLKKPVGVGEERDERHEKK